MKKIFQIFIFMCVVTALTVTTSCSKDDDTDTSVVVDNKKDTLATLTPCGSVSWSLTDSTTPFGSMVVCMKHGNLPNHLTVGVGDYLAAFVGDECRGVWTPSASDASNADGYIVLTVYKKDTDAAGFEFVMKYYSQSAGGYYTTEYITFSGDQNLGSISSPYSPVWK